MDLHCARGSRWPFALSSAVILGLCGSALGQFGPGTGACCIPVPGGVTCDNLTEAACEAAGGSFNGAGTSCFNILCGPPGGTGACVFSNGACIDATEEDCLVNGGVFFGAGTVCATRDVSSPAPMTGACRLSGDSVSVQAP